MRIAVQASDLDNARIDGTRIYLKELLKRFGQLDSETDFFLYHRNTFNPSLAPLAYENYSVKQCRFPMAWMQTRFVWELFRIVPDKLFLPVQAAPLFIPPATQVTITIHDLAFKQYPETFPKWDLWKLNFLLEAAVRRADKLIAVSQSTKNDLLKFFPKLSEKKIKVIHHGFDAEFFSAKLTPAEIQKTLINYKLPLLRQGFGGQETTSYILYVGALQPRKNLVRLIEAFNIAKRNTPEMKLVLAGEPAWLSEGILSAREKSPYKNDIVLTGRVSFEELRVLYQGARLFAFPSLYEGFGLPVLEAFASDVPVLLGDNSSLREVGGDAALYVNALAVDDIAEKLKLLWNDAELRVSLVAKSQEQLKKFSWDKCAKETLEYIQS
jgi:glycosyltransferase involved in cell wall biosynthesis